MSDSVPQAETTATTLARLFRIHPSESDRAQAFIRAGAARRLLEELGIHCDETAALHDLKGFLMSSHRGTEIVTSKDLEPDERVQVYAHLVAHALLGPSHPQLALTTQLEYHPGHEPDERPARELREELVAEAVAQAILAGRLEAAPKLVYCRNLGPGRGRLSRAVLRGLHEGSFALYWHSRRYQRLRSLPAIAAFTERVHTLLGTAA